MRCLFQDQVMGLAGETTLTLILSDTEFIKTEQKLQR